MRPAETLAAAPTLGLHQAEERVCTRHGPSWELFAAL